MISLETARTALRFVTNEFDGEIQDTMNAAVLDLEHAGMKSAPENDPLVEMAVKLYLRWQFDYCGRGTEYEHAYNGLKNSLALSYAEESNE